MRTPAQVERDLSRSDPQLQMSAREFQELTIFLDNVSKATCSARILKMCNANRYGAMVEYVLRLETDIKLHHETFAPFFPTETAKDS